MLRMLVPMLYLLLRRMLADVNFDAVIDALSDENVKMEIKANNDIPDDNSEDVVMRILLIFSTC